MNKKNKEKDINIQPRPPVVVILGHVDHGKSSILDYIRKSNIVAKESGGITQHIGAYEIECPSADSGQARKITFIDTPGHEAFGAIRARGARAADIAILVVAAEDGVKPQTKEAIDHIKKSGLPFIVALNKIDKTGADPERVKRELIQNDVTVESMGGNVPSVEVSAITGQGIDDLLEIILLVAEMEDLKADFGLAAEGVIIEARLDQKRGPTATLLVREGILTRNTVVGTDSTFGKVKILENFLGEPIEEVLPSMPAIALGFAGVPRVGEKFKIYGDMESAEAKVEQIGKREFKGLLVIEEGKKVLNIVLKGDVLGSLEAIEGTLKNLPQDKIVVRLLKSEVGEVNESDIKLAQSAKARIIGFRVKTNHQALHLADREKIKVINFEIIYELIQAVRQLMEKMIAPKKVREDFARIKALVIFLTEKNRQIVGGKVIEGEARNKGKVEILRLVDGEEKVIGKGKLINLQKNKKNMEKLAKGEECGILYEGEGRAQEDDILVLYTEEQVKEGL